MFPLTHLYVNQEVTGTMTPELALGSVLPDILAGLGISWDRSHALKPCEGWPLDIQRGDALHGVGLPGLDHFTDQSWNKGPGYAFSKARHIADRMKGLGLPDSDLIWRGHNQVEMAIEIQIGHTHRQLFRHLKAAHEDRALLRVVEQKIRSLYGVTGAISPLIAHFLHLNADPDVLSAQYARRLNQHYRLEITPGQISEMIDAAWDVIRHDYKDFLSDCIGRLRETVANSCSEEVLMMHSFAKYFDHTNLKPDATREQITRLCRQARDWEFQTVCIHPVHIPLAKSILDSTPVKICTVCGFPLGASTPAAKAAETAEAVSLGAHEVDMVLNIGDVKDGRFDLVTNEVRAVVNAAGPGVPVKVILETCLLADHEIVGACRASEQGGARFVKTSTGFSSGGATVHHVSLMKRSTGPDVLVKASGGIRTLEDARCLIDAGADRLGASTSVQIMLELQDELEQQE